MTPRRITLHEAAERLGVHYMTAYRYVRTGRLPAERDGVQWLIDPVEVERLAAQPSPGPRGRARAVAPARLAGRLVAGDEAGAWAIVESALASGADADDVLVDVVAAAMREIGDGWAAGSLDVSDEHRASVVVQRIVARMAPRFTRRGRRRGTILLGAPAGEEHALPCAILADLLRAGHFEVHDLGADTPTASFPIAADHAERLVGVMIGVTTEGNDGAAAAAFAALQRAGVSVPLFVGGAAVTDADHARRLGADHWTGGDGRAAVAVVERVLSAGPGPTVSRA
jgi:MerR family transcriptional regulator, light-induced transcriptional regulator